MVHLITVQGMQQLLSETFLAAANDVKVGLQLVPLAQDTCYGCVSQEPPCVAGLRQFQRFSPFIQFLVEQTVGHLTHRRL